MSLPVNIFLTQTSKAEGWQASKTEQFIGNDIYLFLPAETPYLLRAIQHSARKIEQQGIDKIKLVGDQWNEATQWAFAMGFTCVGKLTHVEFCGTAQLIAKLQNKLAVYAWSRDLTNQTPAQLYPLKLAELAQQFITEQAPNAVKTNIISGDALVDAGWMGTYNVGKGSAHQPCLVEIDYNPSGDENMPVSACLVGKGITFDSGGYSIKPSAGMFDMKCDMGGAAVVTGALALAIKQGLNKRVKLFLCCAENMVSHNAFKLGDIITYKNGVTVEISNTDAEGRLVLADGLIAASAEKPALIINAATLTGAAKLATGADYTAIFSLDNALVAQTQTIAQQVAEPVWQLPLELWHQTKCSSVFADTANSSTQKGGGYGGASNAAGFLSRFVENNQQGWLHFDLSAAYNGSANGMWAAGATGQGIAVIAQLIL